MKAVVLAAVVALSMGGVANAEVVETGTQGFRLKAVYQVKAPPSQVYQAIGEIGRWWDPEHTYSGKSENLSLPLKAGACWCETLPGGGSVQHGAVVLAWPEKGMIRADAAFGPLQDEGVSGAVFFNMKPKDGGTELTITYNVGGVRDYALKAAPVVDKVLTGSWVRLVRYVETGKP
jgi:hypothetical protein